MTTDWVRWHRDYDEPGSSLGRRLVVVQQYLVRALTGELAGQDVDAPVRTTRGAGLRDVRRRDQAPDDQDSRPRVLSICAGDGRDVLPVLAAHRPTMVAVLIEINPDLSGRARRAAAALGLSGVEVRTADAGDPDSYAGVEPVDVLLACGVFGNISPADTGRTIAALPGLLKPRGIVIWTRGRGDAAPDPSQAVRTRFAEAGFTELAFTAPADARFRVGMSRLETDHRPQPDGRWFTFR